MSRTDLFFRKFPGRGSVHGRNASAQHIVVITALLQHIAVKRLTQ